MDTETLNYAETPVKPMRYGFVQARKRVLAAASGMVYFTAGISTLDKYLRFRPSTYNVIGAQSGTGKTALGMQLLGNIEQQKQERNDNRTTLFFSAEMSMEDLALRIAAAKTGVSVWQVESQDCPKDKRQAFVDALDAEMNKPYFQVCEDNNPDADAIEAACDIVASTSGLAAVMFDYIELTSENEHMHSEKVRTSAKRLKAIARTYKIPTIGISQINKDYQGRADKTPTLTDLRYGGHEPADTVVILQEDKEIACPDEYKAVRGYVVKNRGGPMGTADLLFHGATTTFKPGRFDLVDL